MLVYKIIAAVFIVVVCLFYRMRWKETLRRWGYTEAERDIYKTALESISKNACCDNCQEAALVAKKALRDIQ